MERTNIITFKGNPMTLLGNSVKAGDKAPDFTLRANDLSLRTLADYAGKTLIISVVPSLDTGLCDMQTRRFNSEAAALGEHVHILTLSCDLPFAQARWCGAAGVSQVETLSDYYDLSFGLAYGVVIKELRLLTRSIFVLDQNRLVTYVEIVSEVASEVNFAAALAAAGAAAK
jgi:thiol peroxidase